MNILKTIFWICWRIWFYILMAIPILILLPFLLLSIISEKGYPYFFKMARLWAKFILFGMGFRYTIDSLAALNTSKSYMIVANHTSMIDIMLMLVTLKNPFVFVGKKELANFPIFGFFYKKTCILVDRNSSKSKSEVFKKAQHRINKGLSVCIFPEGGVPDDESILLDAFKDGAFHLAITHKIPILPIVFPDNKKHFSFTFLSGSPGLLRVKLLPIIEINHYTLDSRKELRELVRSTIFKELLDFQN